MDEFQLGETSGYTCFYFLCSVCYTSQLFLFRRISEIAKRLLASSCSSVRPCVRVEQLGFEWTDFCEMCCLRFFFKICRENSGFIQSALPQDICALMTICC
jgi:hypothetical protein